MSDAQEDKSNVGVPDTQPPTASNATNVSTANDAQPIVSPASWAPSSGLGLRFAGRSAVGLVREHNEDNFVIANLTTGDLAARETSLTDAVGEGGMLFAVCDGMGGAAAGEVASQMAVDVLHEAMQRGGFPRERDELARRLVGAVEEAGRRIFDAAQKERSRRGMGTTATAAVLVDKVLFIAEVGDSRAYLFRAGALKQLTKDQSLVNQLIEAGHLTETEAEAFEHSNIILQALGTSETVQVDLTFVELRRGDRLMLCSDGLSGLVHGDMLRDTLASVDDPAECTAALVKFAEAGGGHDNITVVVIDFDGDALEPAQDSDSFGYLQYPLLPAGNLPGAFSDEEITEASLPPGRSSHDSHPGFEPGRTPGVDSNPWVWISLGLLVLLAGAWVLAASGGSSSATANEDRGLHRAITAPDLPAAKPPPVQEEAKAVPVRIFSDVEDAVLLVNGEARGPLASTESRTMDLRPGAYRFEAQSHGNIAAVEVVTVRPDVPLDVYLKLPAGAVDPSAQRAPGVADKPDKAEPKVAAEAAPTAEPEPSVEPSKPVASTRRHLGAPTAGSMGEATPRRERHRRGSSESESKPGEAEAAPEAHEAAAPAAPSPAPAASKAPTPAPSNGPIPDNPF
jgi:serine/threonine protein phosphatase PrpC